MATASKLTLYRERAEALFQRVAWAFLPRARREVLESRARREAFARIAREGRWGAVNASGGGSTLEYTQVTRDILERVLREHEVTSMLDAGCGDLTWVPEVLDSLPETFRYVGADVVPELIEHHRAQYPGRDFRVIDFVSDEIPRCDLIFCRDVIQHLPIADAKQALANFSRSGARLLLTTTHLRRVGWRNARDRRVGACHDRNLLLKPFELEDPIAIYSERDPGHKFLGLWRLPVHTVSGQPL